MTTSIRFPSLIATAIVSVLASGLTTVCAAADSGDVPQVVVKFADLNLSNSQGATKLYNRIVGAANEVCKPFDINSGSLSSRARLDACVHKAIMDAVTKVGEPQLSAVYNAKNHQPSPILVADAQTR